MFLLALSQRLGTICCSPLRFYLHYVLSSDIDHLFLPYSHLFLTDPFVYRSYFSFLNHFVSFSLIFVVSISFLLLFPLFFSVPLHRPKAWYFASLTFFSFTCSLHLLYSPSFVFFPMFTSRSTPISSPIPSLQLLKSLLLANVTIKVGRMRKFPHFPVCHVIMHQMLT